MADGRNPAVLTVDQLETHLWSAADILGGSIDSSDYKNCVSGTQSEPASGSSPTLGMPVRKEVSGE